MFSTPLPQRSLLILPQFAMDYQFTFDLHIAIIILGRHKLTFRKNDQED